MRLSDEQRSALQAPISADTVTQREGGGGKQLDYIEHFRVVSLLNDVFGNGGWSTSLVELRLVNEGERNGKHAASYVARVRLHGDGWAYEDVGFGTSLDRDPGGVHEKAVKEAVSDAEKRCARHLGWSMGLALYEKADGEGARSHVVGEEAPLVAALDAASTAAELEAAKADARAAYRRMSKAAQVRLFDAIKRADGRVNAAQAAE
jgi:DNA repair and recombination protein RAD52